MSTADLSPKLLEITGRIAEERNRWRRQMARFELSKARRLRDEGNHARAAIALLRAKIWRCDPLRTLPESRLMVGGAWKPN